MPLMVPFVCLNIWFIFLSNLNVWTYYYELSYPFSSMHLGCSMLRLELDFPLLWVCWTFESFPRFFSGIIFGLKELKFKRIFVIQLRSVFVLAEGLSWARTAERQSSRMRMEYLKSVFRQDVVFFDTHSAGASTTSQVVTLLSSDANSIQVALCEKVGFLWYLSLI